MLGCAWQVVENNMRNLTLSGHVGFDSLPDQLVNKSVSQGFCFNILCVGQYKQHLHFHWTSAPFCFTSFNSLSLNAIHTFFTIFKKELNI